MPISTETFDQQMDRLTGHFRPGEPTDRFTQWRDEYETVLLRSIRYTDAILVDAVDEAVKFCPKLPFIGEFRKVIESVRPGHVREDEYPALPSPEDVPITPRQRMERIRDLVKQHTGKGQAFNALHRSLVQHAHAAGHTDAPPLRGLTDQGAEWVRATDQRARDHYAQHGTLSDFDSGQPPKPIERDPLAGKSLGEIAPRWTVAEERRLVTQWPHLQKRARLAA